MRKRILLSLAALAILIGSPLGAQENVSSELKMNQFRDAHPQARFHGQQYFEDEGFFEFTGTQNMIYGTPMSTGLTAQESAWNFYNQIEGIYVEQAGKLVPQVLESGNVLQGVMWNKKTETHRFYVFRYNQQIAGLPVYRSGVSFLVRNEEGYPVVASTNNLKELAEVDADVFDADTPAKVTAAMLANVHEVFQTPNTKFDGSQEYSVLDIQRAPLNLIETEDERVVVWAGVTNVKVDEPELAIEFFAESGSVTDFDNYRRYRIIAAIDDGEILHAENQVHSFDVNGTVSGNGTDGMAALECDPFDAFALPYAEVSISGGQTVFADVNGAFNIPSNAGGNVTVNSRLEGLYFDLFDEGAGNSTPVISVNVANPGSVDFLHNDAPMTEFMEANVNCYIHSNIVRDYVLDFEPTFPTIANQTGFDINTNINSSCNAFYNGSSVNFFRNSGSCNNTAIPDVIYHEYGHHLINVTGNGQGQMGEGSSDTIGVLIEDDPDLAPGFFEGQCGSGIRNANNFRSYPCNGPIHDCGQLISGCVWDTMNEIRAIDPDNAREITSALFIGMLIARGQMFPGNDIIGPEITIIFLELDDDDGNIGNGTPHYVQIADAFNAHNMMAPELDLLNITFPNGLPTTLNPAGGTSFLVDVTPIAGSPVADSGMLHYNVGNGFVQIPMNVVDADTYEAVFPAIDCGTNVDFFVSAEADNGGGTVTNPSDAPATTLTALASVGIENQSLDSFDTDTGWTVSGNATDGQWQRAIPNNGDRGDPAVDAEDFGNGFCFVTDNGNTGGDDNTDVDGGSTILTSPILDAAPGQDEIAVLSYYRWYSNDFGASPFNDTFVVEISNNGGATWVNLETVGPTGPEVSGGWFRKQFILDGDIIEPTNNMRIRFNASDLGDGSVIEAAVDGVAIDMIQCDAGCMPGDVNMDGEINLLDVAPFIDAISNGEFVCEADINGDGSVDLLDVSGFIDLLAG